MKYIPIFLLLLSFACGGDKVNLPQAPENPGGTIAQDDTSYIQLFPIWGLESSTIYDFRGPRDILLGREPLIYVADTGNNQVVMMDLAGNIIGVSGAIHDQSACPGPGGPVAIAQDSKLNLLIVTGCNKIYRINLVAVNHDIATAPVEEVFHEIDNPDRQYTGIASIISTVQNKAVIRYYVTATGLQTRNNQVLIFPEDFNLNVPDAVSLVPNGLGILSASIPSGIATFSNFRIDFIFCMTGQNSFKVQWITGSEFGFVPHLDPAAGQDIFKAGKFEAPEDVTVDLEGNLFVVDAQRNRLFKFSSGGKERESFGGEPETEQEHLFNNPQGVAEFNKTLYVADTGNNRIVRFRLSTDIAQ